VMDGGKLSVIGEDFGQILNELPLPNQERRLP